ncbi:MAG: peptide-methionine (S)-S-oxide reductase, partial [Deltaproteobacteria bacterium HGW-Deltaproteobacteria-8]
MNRTFALCALLLTLSASAASAAPKKVQELKGESMSSANLEMATFAGGCFWCVESDFVHIPGVVEALSGYAGGAENNPTYKQVSAGQTGHLESVQIRFDPSKVSYRQLVEWFWRHHDATDAGGQFCDRGRQYGPAIFVHDEAQRREAEDSKKHLADSKVLPKPVVTPIIAYSTFYPAEDYHQRYFEKNPVRYKF